MRLVSLDKEFSPLLPIQFLIETFFVHPTFVPVFLPYMVNVFRDFFFVMIVENYTFIFPALQQIIDKPLSESREFFQDLYIGRYLGSCLTENHGLDKVYGTRAHLSLRQV